MLLFHETIHLCIPLLCIFLVLLCIPLLYLTLTDAASSSTSPPAACAPILLAALELRQRHLNCCKASTLLCQVYCLSDAATPTITPLVLLALLAIACMNCSQSSVLLANASFAAAWENRGPDAESVAVLA